MKLILAILALTLAVGISSSVVELSGTDPAVFDSAQFVKDGVGTTQLGAEIWGTIH